MNSDPPSASSTEFGLFGLTMLPLIGSVLFKPEMESTNTEALEMGKVAADELPVLVLTENQTAGRGRDDNRWESATGSLTFTLALDRKNGPQVPPTLMSLAAGLSIHNALSELAADLDVKLKWPNDVFVGEKKIAGVLIESNKKIMAVGIGINVNNTDVLKSATSLSAEAATDFELQTVLVTIVTHFFQAVEMAHTTPDALIQSAQTKMMHFQKLISISANSKTISGINTGLGKSGELLIKSESSELEIVSGKNLKLL